MGLLVTKHQRCDLGKKINFDVSKPNWKRPAMTIGGNMDIETIKDGRMIHLKMIIPSYCL